jgi:hypothetical protein
MNMHLNRDHDESIDRDTGNLRVIPAWPGGQKPFTAPAAWITMGVFRGEKEPFSSTSAQVPNRACVSLNNHGHHGAAD